MISGPLLVLWGCDDGIERPEAIDATPVGTDAARAHDAAVDDAGRFDASSVIDAGDTGNDSGAPTGVELCDGSTNLRLAVIRRATGRGQYGSDIYSGMSFLLVDGTCQAFAALSEWSEVRQLALTASAAASLAEAVGLDSWASLAGDYCNSKFDGPVDVYWLDGSMIRVLPCQNGPELPAPLSWTAAYGQAMVVYNDDRAEPLTGAVWFTLVAEATVEGENALKDMQFRAGAPWPLPGDPADIASTFPDPVSFLRAEDADAEVLRELRRQVLSGDIGRKEAVFIPIVQPSGARFQLRIRDVTPFDSTELPMVALPM